MWTDGVGGADAKTRVQYRQGFLSDNNDPMHLEECFLSSKAFSVFIFESIVSYCFFDSFRFECMVFSRVCVLLLLLPLPCSQGITREGRHKRRETGGRRAKFRKKRKFEMGRPAAMTKIGEARIHPVRGRGGNTKLRALRLDSGNFAWGTEVCTRKVRVLDVTYNASNNELVRTKTLVKGAIVLIDAHPFKSWYEAHYGAKIGIKKGGGSTEVELEDLSTKSKQVASKLKKRQQGRTLDAALDIQFASGRMLAKITSRPGQTGRCDGYILEGKELAFYQKQLQKK